MTILLLYTATEKMILFPAFLLFSVQQLALLSTDSVNGMKRSQSFVIYNAWE